MKLRNKITGKIFEMEAEPAISLLNENEGCFEIIRATFEEKNQVKNTPKPKITVAQKVMGE